MKAIFLASLLISTAGAQSLTTGFRRILLPFNPTAGTSAGLHKYDGQLEDYSAGVDARVAKLKQFEAEFAKLPADPDRDLVLSTIRAGCWSIRRSATGSGIPTFIRAGSRQRIHHHEPDLRASGSAAAFADRRERKMPAVLAAARVNLKNPPKIYTEIAIQQAPGMISFFQKTSWPSRA
jgi:hypothetical protein